MSAVFVTEKSLKHKANYFEETVTLLVVFFDFMEILSVPGEQTLPAQGRNWSSKDNLTRVFS